jgi:hypothetical protein
VVGHIDAPFTAKRQKTHDKMRRLMRPRGPRDLDAPAPRTRGLAEENIGRSATPGPRVEQVRLPFLPNVDSGTGSKTAGRADGGFAAFFGELALATSTAMITAFLVYGTFTTVWPDGPSSRTAEGHSTEPRLIGPTQAAVERRTQGTKEQPSSWVGTPETTAAQTTGVAAPVGTDSTSLRETPNSQATSAPLRQLNREEIAYLLKRGEELVAAGELGPARLALRRAAEAGDPNATFVLATTYDPILLRARKVIGVAPDVAMARAWYEKAKEFGSIDAPRRLELLARAVKVE